MPLSPLASWSEQPLDIVVVEDHALVRDELVEFLTRPGITVRGVDDGLALDAALRQRHADMLVVDLNLPAEDGLSICQRMRKAFPEMGLILLTARVMPSDKAAGYQSGAEVYLTKPAHVDELEAVVFNLSRRIRRRVGNGLQLDMPQLRLSRGPGESVRLSLLEARILYELALAPERKLSTDGLLLRLDPRMDSPQLRDNLPVTLSRLRQKIAAGVGAQDLIKAVRGHGYQLTQAVTIRA